MTDLVLASSSPRRRELLARLGVSFRVLTAHTEEHSTCTDPGEVARDLALQKADAVRTLAPHATIIAADTLVALDGDILGKPSSAEENERHVARLAGRTHTVHTGVCVVTPDSREQHVEATRVTFRALTDREIRWYAASGEGRDKAGGYGIQEIGLALVERIEGDYSNVVGFPLPAVIRLLRRAGVSILGET